MNGVSSIGKPSRIVTSALLVIWAGIHFTLGEGLLARLPLVGEFFFVDSVIAIVGAIVLIAGLRVLYLPVLVYAWINYLLLTESRILPAPILGEPLPAINEYVIGTFVLDIVIIVLATMAWLTSK
ncbi:hypothetical protein HS1genome_0762 [Sulfodiicoccus acidiphilus]|uniref:Uncharacterized protein n=1 Tax=Sulfodiicoccus acidiphilus TaxID=1670455 RepID=A0A348B2H1_9CREN|nr:hypothetical protein [Sulfodiicoccus acidiphilus]BBD72373.1 hypothetical protein HS1genome_0762 [Sulfodiicoccus acidiphilus]GGU05734.1 hypothetical protein GCM10007116_22580 [Sulfodiicoccus acidiphilus]